MQSLTNEVLMYLYSGTGLVNPAPWAKQTEPLHIIYKRMERELAERERLAALQSD